MTPGSRQRPATRDSGPTTWGSSPSHPTEHPCLPSANGSRLRRIQVYAVNLKSPSEESRGEGELTERPHPSTRVRLDKLARHGNPTHLVPVRRSEPFYELGQHLVSLRSIHEACRRGWTGDEVDVLKGGQGSALGGLEQRQGRTHEIHDADVRSGLADVLALLVLRVMMEDGTVSQDTSEEPEEEEMLERTRPRMYGP